MKLLYSFLIVLGIIYAIGFGYKFTPKWEHGDYRDRLTKSAAIIREGRNQRQALGFDSHLQVRNPADTWDSFRELWYENMIRRSVESVIILNKWYSQAAERIEQRIVERINRK